RVVGLERLVENAQGGHVGERPKFTHGLAHLLADHGPRIALPAHLDSAQYVLAARRGAVAVRRDHPPLAVIFELHQPAFADRFTDGVHGLEFKAARSAGARAVACRAWRARRRPATDLPRRAAC